MFRNRLSRVLASLGISLSLALTALAGPAVILGAQASAIHTATALPGAVSPGAKVAFDISFALAEDETSNLAQLYLTAVTPDGATLLGLEPGDPSQGSCTTDVDLSCSFGAVGPGVEVTLRVVYRTPTTGSSMTVPFNFNTTGATSGNADKGKHSHGDSYATPGIVDLNGSGDFAGEYIQGGDGLQVFDSQALHNRRNPQSTLVNAPEDSIGVTVGEVAGSTFPCPTEAGTCFGQWSIISINDGAEYPGGFSVVLGYKGNIGNATFVHVLDNGDVELIEDECTADPPPASEMDPGCFLISSSNGDSFVTLWLTQNGRVSGN